MPSVSRPDVRPCFRYCARCTPYFARAQRAQHAQRLRARAARKWEFYFARSRSILIRFSIAFSFAQDTVLLPSSDRFEAKFVHVQRETADKLLFNALTDPKVHQISSPRPCRRIPVDPARRHEKLGCLIVVVGRPKKGVFLTPHPSHLQKSAKCSRPDTPYRHQNVRPGFPYFAAPTRPFPHFAAP